MMNDLAAVLATLAADEREQVMRAMFGPHDRARSKDPVFAIRIARRRRRERLAKRSRRTNMRRARGLRPA